MTPEEKQLLLIDLCARLPYKVEVYYSKTVPISTLKTINFEKGTCIAYDHSTWYRHNKLQIEDIKPYLRPMSSMTEEEYNEINFKFDCEYTTYTDGYKYSVKFHTYSLESIEWLNAHHFDYMGLIEKGLAIEAPKEMYE